ncbi:MAG TPA: hypothetical protein VFM88_08960 [Vicinamibacteria bacterium]|nr:hypothetical protein [Vicinamibacteria bacterium]
MLGPKEFRGVRGSLGLGSLALLGGLLALGGLAFPRPLFVNLGAGDEPYARGFRSGWERDGLTGAGETTFHWTLDGSRLEFPFEVRSGHPRLRLRLARFTHTPTSVHLRLEGREVDTWRQEPRGWTVREIDLGEHRGQLRFQFRFEGEDELGIALDWAEIRGAGFLLPRAGLLLRVALLLLVAPAVVGFALDRRAALAALALLLLGLGAGLVADPLGALEAFAQGAGAALTVVLLLALIVRLLRRAWPDAALGPAAVLPALAGGAAAALLLSHPFFYYPDVTTHARFLAALRADPYLAWDASDYQKATGTWAMREIAGQRVAFPYSPAFHLLALPMAGFLGEVAALKAAAALALGTSLLLVHLLARTAGLNPASAALATLILASFPVTASRLTLALFPTLLGQAMDLLLAVQLARRYPLLTGARDATWLFLFLFLAQAAYTGSLFNIALLVALFGGTELLAGDRPKARRLLGAYAASALLVVALQYARFLPVLFREVLPHASASASPPMSGPFARFLLFYGWLTPALALLGLLVVARAPRHARRLIGALLGAGALLLLLRFAVPGVFRDAKEIELLAPSLAVLCAAGVTALGERGRRGRLLAGAALLALVGWGGAGAWTTYAKRFVAVGLSP